MKAADRAFAEALRNDEVTGATAIVARTASYLAEGQRDRAALVEVAVACAAAQPAMAGLRTVLGIAREATDPAEALRHLVERLTRAPTHIARHASELLRLGLETRAGGPPLLRLVTCSSSAPVRETCLMLFRGVDLTVCCAESRPKCEGAALAVDLARAGLRVELFTDAGISSAVPGSHAVVIGADAVGPDAVVNKVGSAALCALANAVGVPVYVLAGREKLLTADAFAELAFPARPWSDPSDRATPGAQLRQNPIFERVPRHLVSQVVTDAGLIN
jgi:translation initiation factor 2B subunit (eIF-2B alpha/beta/delta family)